MTAHVPSLRSHDLNRIGILTPFWAKRQPRFIVRQLRKERFRGGTTRSARSDGHARIGSSAYSSSYFGGGALSVRSGPGGVDVGEQRWAAEQRESGLAVPQLGDVV